MDAETRDALAYLDRMGEFYKPTMHPDMRKALDRVMTVARDCSHSEEFIILYLGFLCSKLTEKPLVTIEELPIFLLHTWHFFKKEMGKQTLAPEVH